VGKAEDASQGNPPTNVPSLRLTLGETDENTGRTAARRAAVPCRLGETDLPLPARHGQLCSWAGGASGDPAAERVFVDVASTDHDDDVARAVQVDFASQQGSQRDRAGRLGA
jgi:hypothetical protein